MSVVFASEKPIKAASNHPLAEPGALVHEPLKVANWGR